MTETSEDTKRAVIAAQIILDGRGPQFRSIKSAQ